PLVYVPRPAFPEYPYLSDWLRSNAPSCELDREAFRQGDWRDALEAALASTQTYPPCPAGGETGAAGIIRGALAGGLAAVEKG
ncbi:MAG TPA: hypothetical protein VNH42_01620, partial [Mariprofundaceae bacterium]|nr:hypothetical protein [Mariprofundaceae bacterium]